MTDQPGDDNRDDGAAGHVAGPDGAVAGDGGAALDAVLSDAAGRLLTTLRTTIDLDAGLAAVRAAVRRTGPAAPPDTGSADQRTRSSRDWSGGSSDPGRNGGSGALDAVCATLVGYLIELDPVCGVDRTSVGPGGSSVLSMAAVYSLLHELWQGLLMRTVDRGSADRLVRLAEHNATEALHLLREQRPRTARSARAQLDSWVEVLTHMRDGITVLRPQILQLFDDAGQTAPAEPAPRLPA